jgi:6-phosphogluconolactonase
MLALRTLLPAALAGLFLLLGVAAPVDGRAGEAAKRFLVYVGTYTRGTKSQGVYRMELDLASGKLTEPVVAGKGDNPSFLALHPGGKYLYAVEETWDFPTKKGTGGVRAFAIQKNGDLTLLNRKSAQGDGPCYLVVDKAGKHVLVANYGGGNLAVLPIEEGGQLAEACCVVQHDGKGANPARQEKPHAHSINLDPANRFAFAADLGLDQVISYRYAGGKLTKNAAGTLTQKPGAGPRHFAFHPTGKFAYVINELNSTITAMTYDAKKGAMTAVQSVSTLPADYKGNNSTAEVVVHPSGKFVYGSNRGADSIAVFTVDQATGKLTPAGWQSKGIKEPRNFAIDPTGKFCLVANQKASTVLVFRIAPTGKLEPTAGKADIPVPVCVRFFTPPC